MSDDVGTIEDAARLVRDAEFVVALTGAGISTESGIPDFRGPQGVWTKDPEAEKLSTLQHYMGSRDVRVRSWQVRVSSPLWHAEPNAGHAALAALEHAGKLETLVTQNIDGLHQAAGSSPERVIEIHGTSREVVCMTCDERAPMERALARVRAGEEDPPCRTCGGILKSATISFGQDLVRSDLERAQTAAIRCDLFLAIGTTLGVYPAAGLVPIALRGGAKLIILNAQETPYDPSAGVVLRGSLGTVLPAIVSAATA